MPLGQRQFVMLAWTKRHLEWKTVTLHGCMSLCKFIVYSCLAVKLSIMYAVVG